MPPDTTRTTTRRTQRKITEEELKDIELKRIKGELSCAECRRLKLRCDKKVPCGSCCRRGCESICPCGILSAGQGTRFILADTDQLHKKIADMSHRIRQLEDALAILQSTVSDQRHPLLCDDLLKVKFGPEATDTRHPAATSSSSPPTVEQNLTDSIDALGTLTLGDSGEVKYFGRSAGSETLIMAGAESDDEEDGEEVAAHASASAAADPLGTQFPFSNDKPSASKSIATLESYLPTKERAHALGESYMGHAANFFRPIKGDELFNSFMPGIYDAAAARRAESESPGSPEMAKAGPGSNGITKNSPHALATLYFLFALGALFDLNLPAYNSEAEHYYELGRSALSLRVIFDSPQMDTVQAMGLMATYHCFAGKRFQRDSAWCVMSFAMKLAQGIGLHRDSARWNMDPKTVQKRRTLFWEVFAADVSHSLALGRPPAMHLSYIDCEFPVDEEATLSDKGEIQSGFWSMKYTFARDLFLAVSDATLVAKSPNYSTILELDRKVREVAYPASFKPYVTREVGDKIYYSSSHSLQGFYASQHRTVTMLYLHRSYFAQAMLDHPTNPHLSPFAPSFLTAFRSASVIIRATAHQFDRCAEAAMRTWFLMYHTFSAAVIVGTVVTRSPSSDMAPGALQDLYCAVDLFKQTATESQRAKIALGVLQRLKEKAVRAYSQYKSNTLSVQPSSTPANSLLLSNKVDDGDDDLAIFGGQTRVLARKSRHKKSAHSAGGASNSPSPPADTSASPSAVVDANDHPPFTPPMQTLNTQRSLHNMGSPSSFHGSRGTPSSFVGSFSSGNLSHTAGSDRGLSPSLSISDVGTSPAQQPNDDLYSNFLGQMASKPAENPTMNTSNLTAYSYDQSLQGFQDLWQDLSPDIGLPKPDTSFNWVPPLQGQAYAQQPQQHVTPAMYIPSSSVSLSVPDPQMQAQYSSPSYPGVGRSYFAGYEPPPVSTGYDSSSDMVTDPTETLLELGLMRGSDIDSGWLSFMQDCGIMDTSSGPSPSLPSSTSIPAS